MISLVRDPIARCLSAFSFTHGSLLRNDTRRPIREGSVIYDALKVFTSCGHMQNYQLASLAAKRSIFMWGTVAVKAGRGEDVVWRAHPSARAVREDLEWLRTNMHAGLVLLAQTEEFADGMRWFAQQLGGGWTNLNLSDAALAPRVSPDCIGVTSSSDLSAHCDATSDRNTHALSASDLPTDLLQRMRSENELDFELHRMASKACRPPNADDGSSKCS